MCPHRQLYQQTQHSACESAQFDWALVQVAQQWPPRACTGAAFSCLGDLNSCFPAGLHWALIKQHLVPEISSLKLAGLPLLCSADRSKGCNSSLLVPEPRGAADALLGQHLGCVFEVAAAYKGSLQFGVIIPPVRPFVEPSHVPSSNWQPEAHTHSHSPWPDEQLHKAPALMLTVRTFQHVTSSLEPNHI